MIVNSFVVAVTCTCICMCILKLKRERRTPQSRTRHILELLFLQLLERSEPRKSRTPCQNINFDGCVLAETNMQIFKKRLNVTLRDRSQELFNLPLLFDELAKQYRGQCLELNSISPTLPQQTGLWTRMKRILLHDIGSS